MWLLQDYGREVKLLWAILLRTSGGESEDSLFSFLIFHFSGIMAVIAVVDECYQLQVGHGYSSILNLKSRFIPNVTFPTRFSKNSWFKEIVNSDFFWHCWSEKFLNQTLYSKNCYSNTLIKLPSLPIFLIRVLNHKLNKSKRVQLVSKQKWQYMY